MPSLMYIICPNCDTTFTVESALLREAKSVRCSKCRHVWAAFEPEQHSPKPALTEQPNYNEASQRVSLPIILPIKESKTCSNNTCSVSLSLTTIGLLLSLLVFNFNPKLLFANLSQPQFCVESVNIKKDENDGKFIVAYKIFNSSMQAKAIPLIRLRLLDKEQRVIATHMVNSLDTKLSPQQSINMETNFQSVPEDVKLVDITVGNKLDFWLQ